MTTYLGVDLSADPRNTGVAWLDVVEGRGSVHVISMPNSDDELVELGVRADVVGVDAPLGWPDLFVETITNHHAFDRWPDTPDGASQRRLLSRRETDRRVNELTGLHPMSVSADRIAALAMRAGRLQTLWAKRWGAMQPRDGSGRLIEVYPAATLKVWGLPHRRYKGVDGTNSRVATVAALSAAIPTMDWTAARVAMVQSDHCFDAVISALTAYAARLGLTDRPTKKTKPAAAREGWIHVPVCSLSELAEGFR